MKQQGNGRIEDRFDGGIDPRWHVAQIGRGVVEPTAAGLSLRTLPTVNDYSNAQIADYDGRFAFAWRPPLRLTVTAWATLDGGALRGTAGFGFWNHPFSPDTRRLRLPRAIWFFFASPPSDMRLAKGVPGRGWKAATIDAARWQAAALMPLALPAALLLRIPALYARLYPPIQRALKIDEAALDPALLAARHTYTLDWRRDGARFAVDGVTALETPYAPRGAAGFVAWLDNQYAVVTPQGKFGFGVVPVAREQALVLESVVIEPG